MSWDISIVDPKTGEVLHAPFPLQLRGGTNVEGGTTELTLNVTNNYSRLPSRTFRKPYIFGEIIKSLDGKNVIEWYQLLVDIYQGYRGPMSEDYWEACPGNARRAIADLIELAQFAEEDSIWKVE